MKKTIFAAAVFFSLATTGAMANKDGDQPMSSEVRTVTIKGHEMQVHVMHMANGKTLYGFRNIDLEMLIGQRMKELSTN